jgi:iron-sulfur cluster repair protein YtfE (RIC family)
MSPNISPLKFDSVTRYLAWDHDRLDGLLAETTRSVDDGELVHARSIFDAFERGMRRHIRVEEDILFPLFEAKTGVRRGPTATLREEHRAILAGLNRMRQALDIGDAAEYSDGLSGLHALLGPHNLKEESVLYPTTDDRLRPDETIEVVDRLVRA